MDELARWLGEQLDVDTAKVRAATPGPWRYNPDKHHHIVGTPLFEEAVFAGEAGPDAICVAGTGETEDQQSMRDAAHIAEHDPARALREIHAKRSTIGEYRKAVRKRGEHVPNTPAYRHWDNRSHGLYLALRYAAAVYEDRPGYAEALASLD